MEDNKRAKDSSLQALIVSLEPSERRYLRMELSSAQGPQSQIANILIDAYIADPLLDEATWSGSRTEPAFKDHFSATKYQVRERILRSMRHYHAAAHPDIELRGNVDEINFLHSKGLWPLLRKRLRKALGKAQKLQRHRVEVELIHWERKLLFQEHPGDLQAQLQALDQRAENLFQLIRAESHAENLHASIMAMSKRQSRVTSATVFSEIDNGLASLEQLDIPSERSFFLGLARTNIAGLRSLMLGQYAEAFGQFEASLERSHKAPKLLRLHLDHYRIAITNFANCCFYLNRPTEFQKAISLMRKFRGLPVHDQLQFETTRYHLEVMHCLNQGNFELADGLLEDLETWIGRNAPKLQQVRLMQIQYNAALLQFMAGDPASALRWIEPILRAGSAAGRQDIRRFAYYMELILRFELGQDDLLNYRLRALSRRSNRYEGQPEFLQVLLQLLSKLATGEKARDKEALAATSKALKKIRAGEGSIPFGLQETLFWVESKLHNQPLRHYLQQQVRTR